MVKRKLDFEYSHEDGLIGWGDGSYHRHAMLQLKQGGFLRLLVYVIRPCIAFQHETVGLGLFFPRQPVNFRNCAASD